MACGGAPSLMPHSFRVYEQSADGQTGRVAPRYWTLRLPAAFRVGRNGPDAPIPHRRTRRSSAAKYEFGSTASVWTHSFWPQMNADAPIIQIRMGRVPESRPSDACSAVGNYATLGSSAHPENCRLHDSK